MTADATVAGMPLSRASLALLPAAVGRPAYDVAAVRTGIVHLGLGGFHRAHMARYTHDLMQVDPAALEWGIAGAGLLPADAAVADALAPQDRLYTLVEREDANEDATVIGALSEVIFAGASSRRLLAAIADPAVRIVSLTVTENGYCLDPATKRLDPAHPAIVHDLANALPASAIGIIVAALRHRRDAALPAFTALSCDNIQHNGSVLRDAVLAFAALRDPGLAGWIAAHAGFPSTMVDRITPLTTAADRSEIGDRFGIADRWPIVAEPFRQWVIEDGFVAGRPAWERVGAQFVTDVAPYEYMKLRLLNASHLAIAAIGQLAGLTDVDETMRDPAFADFMRRLMDAETGPTVPPVPGIDLDAYKATLVRRFANPRIKDTLQRINTDAPLNLLLDPLRHRLARGEPCGRLTVALAAWLRRLAGRDDRGRPLTIVHPQAALLRERATAGGTDPRPLLAIRSLFGDLGDHAMFVDDLARDLRAIDALGARAAMVQATPG